ncbi:DNA replication factor Cdt1-like [Ixodes scapularis]|uniref:DNA replication factor Cdt1-like n=1 Tax=Ixodes scapularis TaxID=6945 RepID=UPI001A9CC002|nr:DNA replication factor Cdt1-like [Ixodes scapularis]
MSTQKQTALTRFYSAKKLGVSATGKEKCIANVATKKIETLQIASPLVVSGYDYVSSAPKRRCVGSSVLLKAPTPPAKRSPISDLTTACKRQRLQNEVETSPLCLPKDAMDSPKKVPLAGAAGKAQETSAPAGRKCSPVLKLAAGSGRLKELHARLEVIEKARASLSKTKQKPGAKLVKESAPDQGAYVRYHHLIEPQSPSLTLPYSYKQLAEAFRCCDTVVSMLFNRKEVCTFDKLKPAVEEMSKRRFSKEKLGQIKAVYPGSYTFMQEKLQRRGAESKDAYQLVVSPQLTVEASAAKTMSPTCLLDRRKLFHDLLLSLVMRHHQAYLSTLSPPVTVPSSAITRWHPKFPLDDVPPVSPAVLPECPLEKGSSSAQDVLNNVKGRLNERVEKALQGLAQKQKGQQQVSVSAVPSDAVSTARLKGVSEDLLARIRAREAFKLVQQMTIRPEDEKERTRLSHLPELIRITRSLFLAEQKAAISKNLLVQKVKESFSSVLAMSEVEELVELASKVLPDWFRVLVTQRGTFVKIVKEKDVNALVDRVTKKLAA